MKSILFLTNNFQTRSQELYGFKTNKHPLQMKELDTFESDLIVLTRSIRYRRVNNNIQQQIMNNLKHI